MSVFRHYGASSQEERSTCCDNFFGSRLGSVTLTVTQHKFLGVTQWCVWQYKQLNSFRLLKKWILIVFYKPLGETICNFRYQNVILLVCYKTSRLSTLDCYYWCSNQRLSDRFFNNKYSRRFKWTDLTTDELGNCYKLFYFLLMTNKTGQPPRCREQLEDHTCFTCHFWELRASVWRSVSVGLYEAVTGISRTAGQPGSKISKVLNLWLKNTFKEVFLTITMVTFK